MRLILSKW